MKKLFTAAAAFACVFALSPAKADEFLSFTNPEILNTVEEKVPTCSGDHISAKEFDQTAITPCDEFLARLYSERKAITTRFPDTKIRLEKAEITIAKLADTTSKPFVERLDKVCKVKYEEERAKKLITIYLVLKFHEAELGNKLPYDRSQSRKYFIATVIRDMFEDGQEDVDSEKAVCAMKLTAKLSIMLEPKKDGT